MVIHFTSVISSIEKRQPSPIGGSADLIFSAVKTRKNHVLHEGHAARSFRVLFGFGQSRRIVAYSIKQLYDCFFVDFSATIFGCTMFDILVASLLVLYFVPMAEAYDRSHPKALTISLLNIFFGWTMIGWVVAFAWAQKDSPVEFYVARNSAYA